MLSSEKLAVPTHALETFDSGTWEETSTDESDFITVVSVANNDVLVASNDATVTSKDTLLVSNGDLEKKHFVTVVSVGGSTKMQIDEARVKVDLHSNFKIDHDSESDKETHTLDHETQSDWTPDQVVVFRLPGERLGMGLKFEGDGDLVERLFIQSVTPESPAARATVPWGRLQPWDEILTIEGRSITTMSRLECVTRLKDASLKVTIGVLQGPGQLQPVVVGETKKTPPLPPKSLFRRIPARPPKKNDRNVFYGGDSIQEEFPPAPAVYHDLFGEEEGPWGSESDETNSSVSTVVDLSSSSSRSSSFSAPDLSKFDLAQALSPFEQLEKELEEDSQEGYSEDYHRPGTKVKNSLKSISRNLIGRSNNSSNKSPIKNGRRTGKRPAPLPPPSNGGDISESTEGDISIIETTAYARDDSISIEEKLKSIKTTYLAAVSAEKGARKCEELNRVEEEVPDDRHYEMICEFEGQPLPTSTVQDDPPTEEKVENIYEVIDSSSDEESVPSTDVLSMSDPHYEELSAFTEQGSSGTEDFSCSGELPSLKLTSVRKREDLGEFLKKELNLDDETELEIEEEEESILECETAEELALVMRALKNHEPFSLNSGWMSSDSEEDETWRTSRLNRQDPLPPISEDEDLQSRTPPQICITVSPEDTNEQIPDNARKALTPEESLQEETGGSMTAIYEQRCSPPSHSRMPPDGHEFPSTYTEIPYEKGSPPTTKLGLRTAASHLRWRRQDERSEKSVKDKIAMFSSAKKIGTVVDNDFRSTRSASPSPPKEQSHIKIGSSSLIDVSSEIDHNVKSFASEADVRPCENSLDKKEKDKEIENCPLSTRSQSMIDIGMSHKTKRHSVGSFDRSSICRYGSSEDREKRMSLSNMIEQRRKSLSKLRGLVIPETKGIDKPPIDLPKITSLPVSPSLRTMSLPRDGSPRLYKTDSISSVESLELGTRRQSPVSSVKSMSPRRPDTPPKSAYLHDRFLSNGQELKDKVSPRSSIDTRFSKSEDSDNDSAVSSTQSSFSQGMSPPTSPMPDHSEHDDMSRHHINRHSPQSSCDELDCKRVLKRGSIEAENRRNVLNSAKCSSGRSSDEQSTPEILRRYSSSEGFSPRGEGDMVDGQKHLRRQKSNDSTTSSCSRRSSLDYSRRNSRETVVHHRSEEAKLDAEHVYFDQKGEMYRESQIKVAYLNEIVDDFEELDENHEEVIAEIPITKLEPQVCCATTDEKWAALELKYGSPSVSESKVQKPKTDNMVSSSGFQAIAQKWKQRADEETKPPQPLAIPTWRETTSRPQSARLALNSKTAEISPKRPTRLCDDDSLFHSTFMLKPDLPDRKLSVPDYGCVTVKLREKKDLDIPSRPTSLIEGSEALSSLESETHYLNTPLSPSTSTDSREDLLEGSDASLSRASSRELLDAFYKPKAIGRSSAVSCSPKMSELLKTFEKKGISSSSHPRMSSLDSIGSDDGCSSNHYGSITSLASGQRDQYGSITSLASSTSIISSQELAQLIEEANHSLDESGSPSHEILVVVLHREVVGHGSIGILLGGGADSDCKEITVRKVIPESLADRDGRIQRGDRILSINGKALKGYTRKEALLILKSPRPEVVLVLSRSRSGTPQEDSEGASAGGPRPFHISSPRPPKILESPMDSKSLVGDLMEDCTPRGPPMTINLVKDGAGLGFSLEGGKDSPLGDRPLTVKKVFTGGAADKGGILKVGDQLLSVNGVDVTSMARIEAWNFLKKLPDGTVSLVIRKKQEESAAVAS